MENTAKGGNSPKIAMLRLNTVAERTVNTNVCCRRSLTLCSQPSDVPRTNAYGSGVRSTQETAATCSRQSIRCEECQMRPNDEAALLFNTVKEP